MCAPASESGGAAAKPRRPLLEGAGPLRTLLVMIYCHFSVAILVMNVAYDLIAFGLPAFILHMIGLLPNRIYLAITTAIINCSAKGSALLPGVLAAQAKKRIEKKRNAHKGHCASLIFGRSESLTHGVISVLE